MAADTQLFTDLKRRDAIGIQAPNAPPLSFAERLDLMEDGGLSIGSTRRHDLLALVIDRDVLPRLALAHRGHGAAASARPRRTGSGAPASLAGRADARGIERLAEIAIARPLSEALSFVERKRAAGMTVDAVYLNLMAPTARLLGQLWEDDLVDFSQVTVATDRLRQVMRHLGAARRDSRLPRHATHRALLAPAPGDQHSFGLAMVAEFFGRAGWHVRTDVPNSEHLLRMVRRDWYAVVGFSVGNAMRLDALSEVIRKIRRLSRNRDIGLMVGGPVFDEHPELVAAVGADATASDGRQAVLEADRLLALANARA